LTVEVANTGKADGEEVVQLYLRDMVSSVVRPLKELKGFQKIRLRAGEKRTVSFTIDRDTLSFFNDELKWVAEPGEFKLMVGSASDDIRAETRLRLR
jgi:beta-glucosidase